jgi:Cu/Ag efflux pump CusA
MRSSIEWNGEVETFGGIIVMRYGMNTLNVIDGVKKKLAENLRIAAAGGGDRLRL